MFKIETTDVLLTKCDKRKNPVKNLEGIPISNELYKTFLSTCETTEVSSDIILFGFEEAIKENKYLENEYPFISKKKWVFGTSGQGDSWLFDKSSLTIYFYDNDQGEYNESSEFLDLNLGFEGFIKMSFIFNQVENLLDKDETDMKELKKETEKELSKLNSSLLENYPFDYFE